MTSAEPVTVQVIREVPEAAPGAVASWVHRGQELISGFEGYLGSGFSKHHAQDGTWQMLFRFTDPQSLQSWLDSPQRQLWATEFAENISSERSHRHDGVVGWFDTAPFEEQAADSPAPPRWKQMVVIFIGFFPMSFMANALVHWLMPPGVPLVLNVLAAIVLVMPFMVYFILPGLTKLLTPWLQKPRRRDRARR